MPEKIGIVAKRNSFLRKSHLGRQGSGQGGGRQEPGTTRSNAGGKPVKVHGSELKEGGYFPLCGGVGPRGEKGGVQDGESTGRKEGI